MSADRTMDWAIRVSRELANGADFEAEEELQARCRFEHKTRTAIILAHGDPREWNTPVHRRTIDAAVPNTKIVLRREIREAWIAGYCEAAVAYRGGNATSYIEAAESAWKDGAR